MVFLGFRRAVAGSLLALLLAGTPPLARAEPDPCLLCHGVKTARATVVELAPLSGSVHADLRCTSCHATLAGVPEGENHARTGRASCAGCHQAAAQAMTGSVHARNQRHRLACPDCHGGHAVLPRSNPASPVSRQEAPRLCARCHDSQSGGPADRYLIGAHGSRLIGKGLLVAASCIDCHGSHAIAPRAGGRAPMTDRCGRCHEGALAAWKTSVHRRRHAQASPSCLDCHRPHLTVARTSPDFREQSTASCAGCHRQQLKTFRQTFHGKAHALKQETVAICHDCHGSHSIHGAAGSSSAERLETCRRCHPGAGPAFATYQSHPDPRDRVRYAGLYWTHVVMLGLLFVVFTFFGVHSVVWLVRSLVFRLGQPAAYRRERARARRQGAGKVFVRFRPIDRFTHLLLMIAFLVLVVTGMPLRYHDAAWARAIAAGLGGVEILRVLHRFGAILTAVYFGMHLWGLLSALRSNRHRFIDQSGRRRWGELLRFVFGPDSPFPNRQDVRDLLAQQRWFYAGGPRPQFDRWAYWEKFHYVAVFWGVTLTGITGVVLWFPTLATHVLPGWALNIAALAHTAEAFMAAMFVLAFHLFNVHFRVDKFPMDFSIVTGRMTEEEMLTERRRLYVRLLAEGRLVIERRRADPIGMLLFAVVVLGMLGVFWALVTHLDG